MNKLQELLLYTVCFADLVSIMPSIMVKFAVSGPQFENYVKENLEHVVGFNTIEQTTYYISCYSRQNENAPAMIYSYLDF